MNLMDLMIKIGVKDEASGAISMIATGVRGFARGTAVAVAAAGTAMVSFGKSAIETGTQFDKSMSQVAATLGVTTDEIGDLRDFAMEMGSTTAFSAVQAADALNYMALAGYDSAKSMEMLPTVLNLAAAGGMDLARASDMVTDAESALGLQSGEAAIMVDQMARTASRSNTSVEQLGDAILTIGGTAQFMAGGTDRLATVLGIMADNGIKGSEAGTHLRNMLLKLSAPTEKGAKLIKDLDLNIYDAATGSMRDMKDIMLDLNDAMADMTDEQKVQTISELFNARDIAAVNALLGTSAERWDELGEAIAGADGAAAEMAKTQLDNLWGDTVLFKSALEGVKIVLSDQLTPALREFVQFGTKGIQEITDGFEENGLAGAMAAFGSVLSEGLTMVIDALPGFVDAAIQLTGAFAQGIVDNLPTIIQAAIEIGTSLITAIVDNLPAFVDAAFQVMDSLRSGIGEAAPTLIPMIVSGILGMLGAIVDNLPAFIQSGLDMIQGIAAGIVEALPMIAEQVPELILGFIGAIVDNLPLIIDTGISVLNSLIDGILTALPVLIEAAPQIISELLTAITENLPTLISAGIGMISTIVDGLVAMIPMLIQMAPQIISELLSAISANAPVLIEGGIQLIVTLISGLGQAIPMLIQEAPALIQGLLSAIIENAPMLLAGGVTMIQNLIDGVLSMGSALYDQFQATVDSIKGIFDFSWSLPDIKLPHFSIGKGQSVLGIELPTISVTWYKKAYENPYLFNKPTVVGNLGFGDGNGGEMVYGHGQLMRDIKQAVSEGNAVNKPINLYLDGDKLVGGTSERMDGSLGEMQAYQLRWEGAV